VTCNTTSSDEFASTTPVRVLVINLFYIIFYFFHLFVFLSFFCENISFDASLISTIIPSIIIINRMYENQKLLYIVPLSKYTIVVCISSISPMAIGMGMATYK
jgi:hypothetical protein